MTHNGMAMTRVLVIDNRDSFVHNLVDYLRQLNAEVDVVDGTVDLPAQVLQSVTKAPFGYDGVLLSPGPGTPEAAVVSRQIAMGVGLPILGVCLGHQVIAVAFGGSVGHAPVLVHGRASMVDHDGGGIFEGLPSPLAAGRYHSLAVIAGTLPETLVADAWSEDGEIMGLHHRDHPTFGVQFHPESVLTPGGKRLLRNFLEIAGDGAPGGGAADEAVP